MITLLIDYVYNSYTENITDTIIMQQKILIVYTAVRRIFIFINWFAITPNENMR